MLRISVTEIGFSLAIEQISLLGFSAITIVIVLPATLSLLTIPMQHMYVVEENKLVLPTGEQYLLYRWISLAEIQKDDEIHKFSKVFIPSLKQWIDKEKN